MDCPGTEGWISAPPNREIQNLSMLGWDVSMLGWDAGVMGRWGVCMGRSSVCKGHAQHRSEHTPPPAGRMFEWDAWRCASAPLDGLAGLLPSAHRVTLPVTARLGGNMGHARRFFRLGSPRRSREIVVRPPPGQRPASSLFGPSRTRQPWKASLPRSETLLSKFPRPFLTLPHPFTSF